MASRLINARSVCAASFLLIASAFTVLGEGYDPLSIADKAEPTALELVVNDEARSREIPVRVYLPPQETPAPVVLFSHGLGGSRKGNSYLSNHWSARGYSVVHLQHPGSDSSVWQEIPKQSILKRVKALKDAANAKNFLLRVKDVSAVLDQLESWNNQKGHALNGRLNLAKIGMSGHSFGAITTQAVSGQVVEGRAAFTDKRIRAALAMSPSLPLVGSPEAAFGKVTVPWMLMTGTKDTSPIRKDVDAKSRTEVFSALPPGGKYEVVFEGAKHSAFGDYSRRWLGGNPNHHKAILALSTAFWDTYLKKDESAKQWLDGDGHVSVLEDLDTWRKK